MQMLLGLFVLRTSVGAQAFRFIGHQFEIFLNYVLAGVTFVFGEKYEDFFFVFKLMPTLIFISSAMSILYHFGAMQWIIDCIAYAMSVTMGTTAAESTSTAACIFLGQPEASLTIRPFLHLMTRSEFFAILTAGFASVTVDVFSIFVTYGMSSTDIITAVLMSAPAGMAISKLICPETEISQTKTLRDINSKSSKRTENVVDAAITGAQDAVSIIASVIAALIAFLSLFAFLNAVVTYLGSLVNIEGLTIDGIIAYPLMPVVYLLGVPWHDCKVIGEVVALKTFVNELVAYQRLSEMVKAGRVITKRSEIVAMYALCGFSNPTSVGVSLGGLSAMAPEKKMVLSKIILMSWLAGCLACFMTAAWAGLLYVEDVSDLLDNSTTTNVY
ncbi:sodium/nucleoside cotransporter 2 [Biomphalaria pfeifferi]|uniref:Sodium/nucleoside cotransporter 2 n=1 Tax=Biomphalaria pfeifferi TaxID=112525 RepID=A0AAD8BUY2_BIOPF|nr:sodium/nucleoside cotransporter 2 [Biomphalaria pfeifferi]